MRKSVARFAAAVLLATGIFAGGSGPANAAPEHDRKTISTARYDSGWG